MTVKKRSVHGKLYETNNITDVIVTIIPAGLVVCGAAVVVRGDRAQVVRLQRSWEAMAEKNNVEAGQGLENAVQMA